MRTNPHVLGAALLIGCTEILAQYLPTQDDNLVPLPAMRLIEGGAFLMGSPIEDEKLMAYHKDERPQKETEMRAFYLSRFPVTNEEFCIFLNDRGDDGYRRSDPRGTGNESADPIRKVDDHYIPNENADRLPAVVTWRGAAAFCDWLAKKTGKPYRLPTEAEWEFAARGPELRPWPWGAEEPPTFKDSFSRKFRETPFYEKHGGRWMYHPSRENGWWGEYPIGSFPRGQTPQGVYDMLSYTPWGEWCSDRYEVLEDAGVSWWQHREEMRVIRGPYRRSTNLAYVWPRRDPLERLWNRVGESSISKTHEGRSWTRIGGDERNDYALIRLALEARPRDTGQRPPEATSRPAPDEK